MNSQIYLQQPVYPTTIPTPIYQKVEGQNPDKSRFYIELLAERFGYPDKGARDIKTMCDFIDSELSNKLGFHANKRKTSRKVYKVKKTSKKKSQKGSVRHCSLCGKTGHTKRNCSGKKTKRVNFANVSDNDDTSDSESCSSFSDDEEAVCYNVNNETSNDESSSSDNSSSDESSESENEQLYTYASKKK